SKNEVCISSDTLISMTRSSGVWVGGFDDMGPFSQVRGVIRACDTVICPGRSPVRTRPAAGAGALPSGYERNRPVPQTLGSRRCSPGRLDDEDPAHPPQRRPVVAEFPHGAIGAVAILPVL